MNNSQKGKIFEKEIAESLGSFELAHPKSFWWRRWPDYRDWIAVSKKLHAPKAPCDFVALWNGRMYAIEGKSTHGERFSLSWIKDHQIDHLLRIEHSGGRGILLISHRKRPSSDLYAVKITDFIILADSCNAKSLKLSELYKIGMRIERKEGGWDLSPLFLGDGIIRNLSAYTI